MSLVQNVRQRAILSGMGKPDIKRVIDFHRLLLQFQAIERRVHMPDTFARENDVEHSYSLTMMAWFLAEYFPKLDRDKIIRYALAHDLVEIHAGDTHVFADQDAIASKTARETAALDQLEKDWPDFPGLIAAMRAYETRDEEEAKFVYALDKIMPIILVFLAEGHSWQKEHITPKQLHDVKRERVKVSPEIAPYYDELRALIGQHPHYFTGTAADASANQT